MNEQEIKKTVLNTILLRKNNQNTPQINIQVRQGISKTAKNS